MDGLFLAQQLEHQPGHHVDGVGGKAVGAGHVLVGVETPENKGGTIHDVQGFRIEAEAGSQ